MVMVDESCDFLRTLPNALDDQELRQRAGVAVMREIEATKKSPPKRTRPSGKLPGWGTLFEICTSEDSNLGKAAAEYSGVNVIRVTKKDDWSDPKFVDSIIKQAKQLPGAAAHASLPCTAWSTWQAMSVHKFGQEYFDRLEERRAESRQMLESFIRLAEVIIAGGGEVSFEWPKSSVGWHQDSLIKFITKHDLYSVNVHGCSLGMRNAAGEPVLKEWRFVTTSSRLAAALEPIKCRHPKGYKHGELTGGSTTKSAIYPLKLCHTMLSSLYGFMERTPAMFCNTSGGPEPIGEAGSKQEHRESEPVFSPFGISPNLQGAGAALFFDLGNQPAHPCRTDEGHSSRSGDLAEVRDQCTGPESSLVGRLADADPDVYD